MAYDLKVLKEKTAAALSWVQKELSLTRTGRAAPAILDWVFVESYGTKMSIRQLASVSIEDARTLRVSPFDPTQVKNIEKAIVQSNLGLSVAVDDKGVRVLFPELTAERREGYLKVAKEKLEEARKKIRGSRDDTWKDIQEKERKGLMSEDEKFRTKDAMQKIVDDASKTLDEVYARKDKEINS